MQIVVPKERYPRERRVAASPDGIKRLREMGHRVAVESGAGGAAGYPDRLFADAGAEILSDIREGLGSADIVLRVRPPGLEEEGWEFRRMRSGAVLVGLLSPYRDRARLEAYAAHGLTCYALELMPRITRAQGMDALSSQSNLAGYAAVIRAAAVFGRAFPMMVTAAGTIAPARTLVLGAGVAGLQAIATARRLGAVVLAMDVRPAVREQVESLGATFLDVTVEEEAPTETESGYAREMGERYHDRQAEVTRDALRRADIVITTALIPGRPAPVLITADMIPAMRPGSVIVDMAVEQGGNCELSERDAEIVRNDVTIIGDGNLPSAVATDASALYTRNLVNFIELLTEKGTQPPRVQSDDEILRGTLIAHDGRLVHPSLAGGGAE